MHREGQEVHLDTDEARGGSTPHIVRWVLGVSLTLVIILFAVTFLISADKGQDGRQDANVSEQTVAPDAS